METQLTKVSIKDFKKNKIKANSNKLQIVFYSVVPVQKIQIHFNRVLILIKMIIIIVKGYFLK